MNQYQNYSDDFISYFRNTSATSKNDTKNISMSEAVESCLLMLQEVKNNNKKIFFLGNGASAAMASHMTVDFCKNAKIDAQSFNDLAMLTCMANDYGYEQVFAKPLSYYASSGDLVVAISSSGQSTNIVEAVKVAEAVHCKIVTLSGFETNNRLRLLGDINFYVPANSYGFVEAIHQVLLHMWLDLFVKRL